MREGTSTHLALLAVELYEITEKFIYELRQKQHERQNVFDNLPEYTINKNENAGNAPIRAEYFHQFMGVIKPTDDKKYLYFNLATDDGLLHDEISNSGMEDLFQGMDFEKYLSKFKPANGDDLRNFRYPNSNYLVVELIYTTSCDYYSGGYDCEMDIDIIGYLDHNFQRQPFEPLTTRVDGFKKGDKVLLPFNEEGKIIEYVNLPWASRYNVKITKSNGFNKVGDVHDFFEKHLQLKK